MESKCSKCGEKLTELNTKHKSEESITKWCDKCHDKYWSRNYYFPKKIVQEHRRVTSTKEK